MPFSDDVKLQVGEAQNRYCATNGCRNKIHSFHHKLHDIIYNRRKFPLFIDSPFNCVGLCYRCHKHRSHMFRITEELAEVFEWWLNNLLKERNCEE